MVLHACRTSVRLLLVLMLSFVALPGCAVVVIGGVAVAAGAIIAINVVNEDTVRSELKDVSADQAYAAALRVLEQRGTVRAQNAEGMRLEGEVGSDRVEITVVVLESTVAIDVKARTMADVVPATETARSVTQSILNELGVTAQPPTKSPEPGPEAPAPKS